MQTLETALQRAGLLAGAQRFGKGLGQVGGVVLEALGQRIAGAHLLGDLIQHSAEVFVLRLGGYHGHAALHRQPGGQNDGELGAQERQLFLLDPEGHGAGEHALLLLGNGLQLRDDGNALAELVRRLKFIVGAEHTGDFRAAGGLAFITECGHGRGALLSVKSGLGGGVDDAGGLRRGGDTGEHQLAAAFPQGGEAVLPGGGQQLIAVGAVADAPAEAAVEQQYLEHGAAADVAGMAALGAAGALVAAPRQRDGKPFCSGDRACGPDAG